MKNNHYPFVNLPLNYAYDALEPFIDEKTMWLHHNKHLQTYINNLNTALENKPRLQRLTLEQLIRISSQLPDDLSEKVRNNAGGVYNHRFFFDGLSSESKGMPHNNILNAINRRYGNFAGFKSTFKKAALSVFGSGYAWLISCCGDLKIITTPNQNSPIECGLSPILTIDVWEHAYYLKHYNLRADYIDDWFNVINWDKAEENFLHNLKS